MLPNKSEYFANYQPQRQPTPTTKVEYAKVVAFDGSGAPLIRFVGETVASSKIYAKMRHYNNPQIGDRVLLINNIIIGTWTNE